MLKISGPLLQKFDSSSVIAKDLNAITAKIGKKDATLWGPMAEAEASVRLNWVDLPSTSRALLPQLEDLKNWVSQKNLKRIILCGMGGSSLAPEVFGKSFAKEIFVLDSTDPEHINLALDGSLQGAVVIVGSKSGSTIETASQKAFFQSRFEAAGLKPQEHMVIITDPNSPLDKSAKSEGYKVVNADPNVGGRFSALSAFGLVPAVLMGIDISRVLDEAQEISKTFSEVDSSVVKVATLILEQSDQIVAFCDANSNVPGLSDWIEQLVAESTGKDQVGRLPVVIESIGSEISSTSPLITFTEGLGNLSIVGTLAEQFIFWEWVTALLGRGLNVDPFNQPNVTEAKDRTGTLLGKWNGKIDSPIPAFEDESIAVFTNSQVSSLDEALAKFFAPNSGYIAVMAYLNRENDQKIATIRELIADKTKRATTFGWGPRFLHSTGQFHKGGQPNGAFLQISGESSVDFQVPDKNFTFHTLFMAQVLGDGEALSSRNLPLMRIHLKDRKAAIEKVIEAIRKL